MTPTEPQNNDEAPLSRPAPARIEPGSGASSPTISSTAAPRDSAAPRNPAAATPPATPATPPAPTRPLPRRAAPSPEGEPRADIAAATAPKAPTKAPTKAAPARLLTATNLALSAEQGTVYGPVSLTIRPGLTVLVGERGTGKTSLLLTLAGRMKPSEGTVELYTPAGTLPANATTLRFRQKVSQIAGFVGIDELDESVTVAATIRERLSYLLPWYTFLPRAQNIDVHEACDSVFGEVPVPAGDALNRELSEEQQLLFRVALASLASPRVIFIDDLTQAHSSRARLAILRALDAYTRSGTAVVCASGTSDDALYSQLLTSPTIFDLTEVAHS